MAAFPSLREFFKQGQWISTSLHHVATGREVNSIRHRGVGRGAIGRLLAGLRLRLNCLVGRGSNALQPAQIFDDLVAIPRGGVLLSLRLHQQNSDRVSGGENQIDELIRYVARGRCAHSPGWFQRDGRSGPPRQIRTSRRSP